MPGIGVICGLQREARCLQGISVDSQPLQIICSGASSGRAFEAAELLASRGCRGLVSFGLAGGLAADLIPGTLIAADAVVTPDGRRPVDAAWLGGLKTTLPDGLDVVSGLIAGSDVPVATRAAKSDLARSSGALAVDMESHAVAAAAAAANVPFLVVRAVADPAARTVPGWVMSGIDRQGRVKLGIMITGVLIRPWSLPGLIGLAADSRKAYAALSRVAFHAGSTFGFGGL